jgi:transmembrane sensor
VNNQLVELFFRYLKGSCSPLEIERVIEILESGGHYTEWEAAVGRLAETIGDGQDQALIEPADSERLRQRLLQSMEERRPARLFGRQMRYWIPYAAAVIFVVLVGTWLYTEVNHQQLTTQSEVTEADAQPAGNRATLTLADGRAIALYGPKGGIVVGDDQITYQDRTEGIVYLDSLGDKNLVLATPKGGVYTVVLPDGSRVWLNAASRLSYPARFSSKQRLVEIEGEGYFEIAKDAKRPFKLKSRGQEIVVLGTAFNISAYADDKETKTTLVSGAVRVTVAEPERAKDEVAQGYNGIRQLLPGEQSTLRSGALGVKRVDVATQLGWRNGDFVFDGLELREAMKQLSRWYNVEVVYEDDIPPTPFYGSFSRNLALAKALEILKEGQVNFSLKKKGAECQLIVKR